MSPAHKWHADTTPARELFAAAAVRERFVPSDLLAQWTERHGVASFAEGKGAMAAVEATLDLEQLAEPALAADGSEAFTLPRPIRLDVLKSSDSGLLRQSLPEAETATLTELALRDFFAGAKPQGAAASRPELSAYIAAVEWAQAAGLATEIDLPELNRRQGVQDFVEALSGNELSRFVGRERLLASLHQLWSLRPHERPMILLEGPGGIGKSLLVAKFLTQLIDGATANRPDGVFIIDFERHEFRSARVSAIFREMIHQAARWWRPEAAALLEERSDDLDYGGLESVSQVSRSSEAMQDDSYVASQLADFFRIDPNHTPRFVVFADTFEEVAAFDDEAANSVARACSLLRQGGVDVLELYASRAYPSIPAWPRPPARFPLARLPQREAQDYLRREAKALGIVLSRKDANAVQHKIGGWPLNLRLAVGLMGDAATFDPVSWIASLESSDKRVQATLYQRFLDRIRDSDVRKLAMPGLLLRRLTGPIIEQVLAASCKLAIAASGGDAIIARARAIGQLFVTDPSDPGAVWHRADLRALMHADLRNAVDAETRREIHRGAVSFYGAKLVGEIERAEHLYHLLQLGEPAGTLDTFWTPELGPRLKSALAELPEASAAWLRTKLGAARVSTSIGGDRPATVSTERLQELRLVARRRFQEGNADIDDLLAEAGLPHSALSEFGDLYIQSLAMNRMFRTALTEAYRLINSRKRVSGYVRAGAYAAAAAIHEGQDRLDEAHLFWSAARRNARGMEPIELLNTEIGELRITRRIGWTLAQRKPAISRVIKRMIGLSRELSERRVAAREALAEVAEAVFPGQHRSQIGILLTDLCTNLLRRDELFVWAKKDEVRRLKIFSVLKLPSSAEHPQQVELNNICSKMIYGTDPEFWPKLTEVVKQEVDWSLLSSSRRRRKTTKDVS